MPPEKNMVNIISFIMMFFSMKFLRDSTNAAMPVITRPPRVPTIT